jgi:hypothetical protein
MCSSELRSENTRTRGKAGRERAREQAYVSHKKYIKERKERTGTWERVQALPLSHIELTYMIRRSDQEAEAKLGLEDGDHDVRKRKGLDFVSRGGGFLSFFPHGSEQSPYRDTASGNLKRLGKDFATRFDISFII